MASHGEAGSIPRLAQWVKGSGAAAALAVVPEMGSPASICCRVAKKKKKVFILEFLFWLSRFVAGGFRYFRENWVPSLAQLSGLRIRRGPKLQLQLGSEP